MQTQTLPIQVSGPSAAPQRANSAANGDNAQFSQALTREMEQRQNSPAPAAPATPQSAPAQQAQTQQAPAPAQAQAKPAEGKPAAADKDASADEARDDAANAAAPNPVADMLALVASFNQPAAAAPAAAQPADPAGYASIQAGADVDAKTAVLAAAAKAQALPAAMPAADDKAPAFKDVAQAALDGVRLAMKAAPGAAEPKLAAAPKSVPAGADVAPVSSPADSLTALAGGKVDARAAAATAPAMPAADTAPLRARETVADVAILKDGPAAAPAMAPVQQASVAMAQGVIGAPADRIAARVGTPAWDNQVGQKIVWMVAGKEQSASLTLNPPDMGPMQVVLNVTNDQATVTFTAAQPEVRQALENAMPKLREMMSENGIALGNATVNAGMPDQRQAQQGEQSRGQGSGSRFGGTSADTAPIAATPRRVSSNGGTGLVDTFA